MCGIAGIVSINMNEVSLGRLKSMTDIIAHRGPDGEGYWTSDNRHVGLGHRRLSIIDLSHAADQPMHYLGRYSLVFNGEIYNYLELKETLLKEGCHFKTSSDTEVLLGLYDRDKEDCLQLLDGMFSFVIYDKQENEIFAARDRFGEKPFFYSYIPGKHFLFGSEMKCLWEAGVEKKVNNRMLYNYLSYGYLDNPNDPGETFYENCTRLPHSHYLKLSVERLTMQVKKYYDIDWQNIDHSITTEQAVEKFNDLFFTSVKRRLRSDVTVGSSLSGGLDSSLVVTAIDELKKGTGRQQDTFSAVFPGFKRDERKYMDHVIGKTHVNPHFVTPDDEGLIASIDKLSWHQEEPYGSASIYVQYCVMGLAKANSVTVLLDGQGADEVLAGYHKYYADYFSELRKTGRAEYKSQLNAYRQIHSSNPVNGVMKRDTRYYVRNYLGRTVPMLRKARMFFSKEELNTLNKDFYNEYRKEAFSFPSIPSSLNESLYQDSFANGSLQQLLRYADRNSMAHSREVRLPFLFHELVDFLFSLPITMKINHGWTKWILREAFKGILPKEITWRKDKIGYEPPQQAWMERPDVRTKLNDSRQKLVNIKILNPAVLKQGSSTNDKAWRYWMSAGIV